MTSQEKIAATEAAAKIVVALIEGSGGYKISGNPQIDSKHAAEAFQAVYAAIKASNHS